MKLSALLTLFAIPILAQTGSRSVRVIPDVSYGFRQISIEEGLSQLNITRFHQDTQGFMWIGTESGLNRFDGYDVHVYMHSPDDPHSLASNHIEDLLEDSKGYLWLVTKAGLERMDPKTGKTNQIFAKKLLFSRDWSHDFLEMDGAGHVWFGYAKDIYRVDPNTLKWQRYELSWDKQRDGVRRLISMRSGLWITTRFNGLWRFDEEADRFVQYTFESIGLPGAQLDGVLESRDGRLWLGFKDGPLAYLNPVNNSTRVFPVPDDQTKYSHRLFYEDSRGFLWTSRKQKVGLSLFDMTNERFVSLVDERGEPQLMNETIRMIFKSDSGYVWIGTTGGGMWRFDPEAGTLAKVRDSRQRLDDLYSNMVERIFQDRSGLLWFSTGQGASTLDPKKKGFKGFREIELQEQDMLGVNTRAILEESNGDIWLGTLLNLKKIDHQTGEVTRWTPKVEGVNARAVGSLLKTKSGRFFIGTWAGGLFEFDNDLGAPKPVRPDVFRKGQIYGLMEDYQGDLWLSSATTGLYCFDLKENKVKHYTYNPEDPTSLPINGVFSTLEHPYGDVWVGTYGGGLARWSRETEQFTTWVHQPGNPQTLSSNDIRALHLDAQDCLWIGTQGGGLNRYDEVEDRFEAFTIKEGLPDNTIYAILQDQDGHLWLSTNRGLCRFDPISKEVMVYGQEEGLQHAEFNTGSRFLSDSGEMFFGGVRGFNRFKPEDITTNTYVPPIAITRFMVFDREEELINGKAKLDYRQNFFTLEYAALSYPQNHRNQYAYMLNGVDADWVEAGSRRRASYTNVPPGTYVFRVKGSNHDGLWNESGAEVLLEITPPFWKTLWFQIFMALLIPLLGFLLYAWRMSRIKRHNQQLSHMVEARTSQLEEARLQAEHANKLKSSFLAKMTHEIRTPLNAILGFTDIIQSGQVDAKEKQHYLRLIHESGDTLLQLLNNVLDINKIEDHKLVLEQTKFDLGAVTVSALTPYMERAEQLGLKLIHYIPSNLPGVFIGDPTRIKQCLINLVSNSLKFTQQGGVEVRLRVLQEDGAKRLMRIEVTDSGVGVGANKQARIFDRFTQEDDTITRKYGGSGLGLSIVKELTTLMGGETGVESPAGQRPFETSEPGSYFWFTFLIEVSTEDHVGTSSGGQLAILPHELRVLVAEDNRVNQKLILHVLSNLGMATKLVENGEMAVEAAINERFDVVLMDIQMPVMDGYEATRRIKQVRPNLPVIGLSANVYQEALKNAEEAGMDDYIAKPFKKHDLVEKIANNLRDQGSESAELL